MRKQTKEVQQATGQLETGVPTSLDMIFGETGHTKYNTLNEAAYVEQLTDMNLSDLQAHAYSVELVPVQDRNILTKRLVREFRKHVLAFTPDPKTNIDNSLDKSKLPKDIRDILSEGA